MPKLNELQEKYSDKGLVIIGVHSDPRHDEGRIVTRQTGVKYPVAFDNSGLMKTLGLDSFPDYVIVDKSGKIRVVDLANAKIEELIVELLKGRSP